jgi:predicted site-specific integrase-resolvase
MDAKENINKKQKNNPSENIKVFVGVAEASKISGMHPHTIRKYANENKIKSYKTPSGQIKINKCNLEALCNYNIPCEEIPENTKCNYIYARVSSKKQLDDLERQVDFIRKNKPEYNTYIIISDVASGINFKRKGLETILDSCIQRTIGEIVVAHRDRLCRFAFELLKLFIEKSGGKITVLDDERNKSTEQDLSEDLLSIIHIYSCRQMGKRKYKNKQSNDVEKFENKIETFKGTEKSF